MVKFLNKIGVLLLLISSLYEVNAQQITDTRWMFGNSKYSLVFDANGRGVRLDSSQAVPFGKGGTVSIVDQFSGNLLFYSDGNKVYDNTSKTTPNGNGLSADANQNVAVVTCPVLGKPGQYYLFTNGGTKTKAIQFSILNKNLKGNGTDKFPLGDVSSKNQATTLANPSEGMLIIPQGNGKKYWLLSQNKSNFNIQVTPIDKAGIGKPTNFNFNKVQSPAFEIAHFAYHADSSWLAAAPKMANRNAWLMKFNKNTGVLTFDTVLQKTGNNDNGEGAIYDMEWSPNGKRLYFSKTGGNTGLLGNLYQIDLDSGSKRTIMPLFAKNIHRSFGLQKAIDNKIYHLYQEKSTSPILLGRINRPDSLIDSVRYQKAVFNQNFEGRQFPSFAPAYDFEFDSLDFSYIDSCENNITKFFPVVIPTPQQLSWDFGDNNKGTQSIPNHTYEKAGGYMVKLTAEIAGISKTITKPVEIIGSDLEVNLGNDTTICINEILTLDAGQGAKFIWNTGAITQTIKVDTAGTYWVEVTNATGCTGFDEIEVTEYSLQKQTSNQWYFGEKAGIEFTNGPIAISDANQMEAPEGCATISDEGGELLFYTNGVTVWNKDHQVMINGENIGGELKSAQNSMILPFGKDRTMYYIFTTEEVYGDNTYNLKYSIVDLKADKARGKVVVKNVVLSQNSTERLTASGFTGNDLMLAHDFGNDIFRAYNTSENGLSSAVFSPSGKNNTPDSDATGYMKFSPDKKYIAMLLPASQQVQIADFNEKTGNISKPKLIDVGEPNLYGLEFSPDNKRLYLTTSSATSKLIQYDLDSIASDKAVEHISKTKYDGYPTGANYGALQIAPNGVIYMAKNNSTKIGTINSPNGNDDAAGFNNAGFDLQGKKSRLGLPNFAQNQSTPIQQPSMSVTEGCTGTPTNFTATGRDNSIENYSWIFGDGQGSAEQNPKHTYNKAGTYNVQLTLSNRCDQDTVLFQTIQINNIPERPTVPTDTALCDQTILLSATQSDNSIFSYYWSTGDTTRQIKVTKPNIIKVALINKETGCSSDTVEVFIADARPAVDLGADRTVCQNSGDITLDGKITTATYEWTKNGTNAGTNRTLTASTAEAGRFEYIVKASNSIGCTAIDTLIITVQPEPLLEIRPRPTTGCGKKDGSLSIKFNSDGSYTYRLSGTKTVPETNHDGVGTVNIPNLGSGNYTLFVNNLITGCNVSKAISIEDPASFQLSTTAPNACINEGKISISFGGTAPANFNLTITKPDATEVSNKNLATGFTNPVADKLDTGTYIVAVKDLTAPNCVETDTVRIQLLNTQPSFTFDAVQDICGTQGIIKITDASNGTATYTWTGGGIVGKNTGTSITVNKAGEYQVTATATGSCPRIEKITVRLNTPPKVAIAQSGDPCLGEVILTANVTGGSGKYLYDWNNGSKAQRNTVTKSGKYFVKITDQQSGCEVTSDTTTLQIEKKLTVTLTSSPNCKKPQTVNLLATPSYQDGKLTYTWKNTSGTVLPTKKPLLEVSKTGTYTVSVASPSGKCIAKASRSVTVKKIDSTKYTLPQRVTFCPADPKNTLAKLDAGNWNTFEWRILGKDTTVLSTDRVFQTNKEGRYVVTLSDGFTCTTDTVRVEEDCRPIIFAPNAFVPNGINKTFSVFPNPYVTTFEIKIYSRWGELVYKSNDLKFEWNGIFNRELLPAGTYAYVMRFSGKFSAQEVEQRGGIMLIR